MTGRQLLSLSGKFSVSESHDEVTGFPGYYINVKNDNGLMISFGWNDSDYMDKIPDFVDMQKIPSQLLEYYGFPKDAALDVALSEIGKFLLTHDMKITLVVFDTAAFELSEKLMGEIKQFIDEQTAADLREQERFQGNLRISARSVPFEEKRRRAILQNGRAPVFPDIAGKNLSETVGSAGQTFQEKLFELIDKSGMDDVTVYKKANIDRKVFSRIRSKRDYKPKKKTAVAFAIALELDLPTTIDLLARAEIAFSQSNLFDLIIAYFITHGIYDMFEINAALFQYDQPVLGE